MRNPARDFEARPYYAFAGPTAEEIRPDYLTEAPDNASPLDKPGRGPAGRGIQGFQRRFLPTR